MKKKLIIVLLLVVISLSAIFSLTACNGSTKYVCETNGFTDEYIILMDNTQYKLYNSDGLIEEGSYSFISFKDGTDRKNITFRPYNPDLTGAKIDEIAKTENYEELFAAIGQYDGNFDNDIINLDGKSYKKV